MIEQMSFADGKYTVINDNGNLTALRHGNPWQRDLTGDNLAYWMLVEALELKQQRDELLLLLQIILGKHSCGALTLPCADLERIEKAITKLTN